MRLHPTMMRSFLSRRSDSGRVVRALFGLVFLAVSAAAPGQPAAQIAGLYEIRQMEMAGGLKLQPDGRFRYALEYGAASEQAEGDWVVENDRVLLTSNPKPNPPSFVLVEDEPAPGGHLSVTLEPPGFGWTGRLDLVATIAGQEQPAALEASSDGTVDTHGKTVTSVRPVVPVYGLLGDRIPLSPGGHRIVLRFMANDLGRADFEREPLTIKDGKLVMRRYGAVITFRPVK